MRICYVVATGWSLAKSLPKQIAWRRPAEIIKALGQPGELEPVTFVRQADTAEMERIHSRLNSKLSWLSSTISSSSGMSGLTGSTDPGSDPYSELFDKSRSGSRRKQYKNARISSDLSSVSSRFKSSSVASTHSSENKDSIKKSGTVSRPDSGQRPVLEYPEAGSRPAAAKNTIDGSHDGATQNSADIGRNLKGGRTSVRGGLFQQKLSDGRGARAQSGSAAEDSGSQASVSSGATSGTKITRRENSDLQGGTEHLRIAELSLENLKISSGGHTQVCYNHHVSIQVSAHWLFFMRLRPPVPEATNNDNGRKSD